LVGVRIVRGRKTLPALRREPKKEKPEVLKNERGND